MPSWMGLGVSTGQLSSGYSARFGVHTAGTRLSGVGEGLSSSKSQYVLQSDWPSAMSGHSLYGA
jgi:hypothetical protein